MLWKVVKSSVNRIDVWESVKTFWPQALKAVPCSQPWEFYGLASSVWQDHFHPITEELHLNKYILSFYSNGLLYDFFKIYLELIIPFSTLLYSVLSSPTLFDSYCFIVPCHFISLLSFLPHLKSPSLSLTNRLTSESVHNVSHIPEYLHQHPHIRETKLYFRQMCDIINSVLHISVTTIFHRNQ